MVSSSLPNIQKIRIRPNQIQNIIRHQSIIQQQISALDHSQCLNRQELSITRPCPHQEHIARPLPLTPIFISPLLPQNLKQLLELRELHSYVIVPNEVLIGGELAGARGLLQLALVHPAVALVPLD